MMTEWYQKSMSARAVRGKTSCSQDSCSQALRMPSKFYGKEPEQVDEAEPDANFLRRLLALGDDVGRWCIADRAGAGRVWMKNGSVRRHSGLFRWRPPAI